MPATGMLTKNKQAAVGSTSAFAVAFKASTRTMCIDISTPIVLPPTALVQDAWRATSKTVMGYKSLRSSAFYSVVNKKTKSYDETTNMPSIFLFFHS